MPNAPIPERIWLQCGVHDSGCGWTWADHATDASDIEYVRADSQPSNAALAICETMLTLYSASGEWLNDEEGASRVWRMLQVVNGAPRSEGERWAPDEAILRPFVARMTGKTIDEVTEPLSRFLHELRFGRPFWRPEFGDDAPGMVVTDLDAWEDEDGG